MVIKECVFCQVGPETMVTEGWHVIITVHLGGHTPQLLIKEDSSAPSCAMVPSAAIACMAKGGEACACSGMGHAGALPTGPLTLPPPRYAEKGEGAQVPRLDHHSENGSNKNNFTVRACPVFICIFAFFKRYTIISRRRKVIF